GKILLHAEVRASASLEARTPSLQISPPPGERFLAAVWIEAEEAPARQHVTGERRRHIEAAAARPRQHDAAGVQMELARQAAAFEEGALAAIFAVAEDRRAEGGGVHADLMGAAGERPERDPGDLAPGMVDRRVV